MGDAASVTVALNHARPCLFAEAQFRKRLLGARAKRLRLLGRVDHGQAKAMLMMIRVEQRNRIAVNDADNTTVQFLGRLRFCDRSEGGGRERGGDKATQQVF